MRANGDVLIPIIQTREFPMGALGSLIDYRSIIRTTDGTTTFEGPWRICYADALTDARQEVDRAAK